MSAASATRNAAIAPHQLPPQVVETVAAAAASAMPRRRRRLRVVASFVRRQRHGRAVVSLRQLLPRVVAEPQILLSSPAPPGPAMTSKYGKAGSSSIGLRTNWIELFSQRITIDTWGPASLPFQSPGS